MDMVVAAAAASATRRSTRRSSPLRATRNDRGVLLNEKLTTELRPTLFLAQLSNLLAGNISIVHKVTGSSRTFMGEEGAGVSAVETAAARIRSGQSTHVLVGGAFKTEHPDMLLGYELGRLSASRRLAPLWQREGSEGGGVVSGSGAAFLVLESREHAEKRGASDLCPARPGRVGQRRGAATASPAAIATLIARRDPGRRGDAGDLGRVRRARGDHGRAARRWKRRRPRRSRLLDADRPPQGSAVSRSPSRLPRWRSSTGTPILPFDADVEKAFAGKPGCGACDGGRLSPVRRHGAASRSGLSGQRTLMPWPRRPIISAGRSSPSPASASSPRSASARPTIGRR